jgi:intracellular multiplication protein IcmL
MFGQTTRQSAQKGSASPNGGAGAPKRSAGILEEIALRNDFYRIAYQRQARTNQWLIVLLVLAIGVIGLQVATRPTPKWIAMDTEGRIIELKPLDQPAMTTAAISAWAERVVREVNTLDYVHWRDQLARVQPYFTTTAWERFLDQFERSGNREQIETKRVILSVSTEPSRIVQEGVNPEGVYTWKVEIPININAHSTNQTIVRSRQVVHLTVSRVDARVNPSAPVLVRQYVAVFSNAS